MAIIPDQTCLQFYGRHLELVRRRRKPRDRDAVAISRNANGRGPESTPPRRVIQPVAPRFSGRFTPGSRMNSKSLWTDLALTSSSTARLVAVGYLADWSAW